MWVVVVGFKRGGASVEMGERKVARILLFALKSGDMRWAKTLRFHVLCRKISSQ